VSGSIKVLLIDHRPVIRDGLRMLLEREPDIDVIGQAASPSEAAGLGLSPDIVLTDAELADVRGRETIRALRPRFPAASIIVLTNISHPLLVQQILSEGPQGYILRTATTAEVLQGLRQVAAGQRYLQPSLGLELARWHSQHRGPDPSTRLSPREEQVLRLIALGHTNTEIAHLGGVSLRTVETQRSRLLQKLGRRTRAELVRYALAAGLVDLRGEEG
jgi:two-component system response regulator NreC